MLGGVVALGLCLSAPLLSSPAQAEQGDPDYFQVNMKPGSQLNVRKDPSVKAEKVGTLKAGTDQIANLGCHVGMPYLEWRKATTAVRKVETRRKWCNIEYNGMIGWTAGQYLQEDRPE
ncbi:MAG: hypothetical protein COB93_01265 [Sneathiella sp.]|nr:MAG: hypothetical protein COB93_01265 [Sneathiella sp.]